ncbi:MAG: phage protein GemA/Gp16 family protein [Enterocloster bolteae]
MSYREAESVIARLTQLQGGQALQGPGENGSIHRGLAGQQAAQQKKIWALMYELAKYDKKPGSVSLGDRLCAIIKRNWGRDATARHPLPGLTLTQETS